MHQQALQLRRCAQEDATMLTEMSVMKLVIVFAFLQTHRCVLSEIRGNVFINKLIKPVGGYAVKNFVPLTEIPPPHLPDVHMHSGRRHFEDCKEKPKHREVFGGEQVDIFGEYYDDNIAKTVATVIIPDHIDRKHFEVTTQVPYFTVGTIEALGYHPSTIKSEHPSECEKIYQDHLDVQYSDEAMDYSEESLEMARMPLAPAVNLDRSMEERFEKMYSDFER